MKAERKTGKTTARTKKQTPTGGPADRDEGRALPESIDLAKRIVEVAADRQASNVVLLDAREVCSFADYFVICSGESNRQMEAIREAIAGMLRNEAHVSHHGEGDASSGWMLLDLGSIIVHIFTPFEREYYQLEELWSKAPILVKVV
jgi:ribosome-associated protein